MTIDKTEALADQLKDRYRDYLKELSESDLIDTLKNVCLFDFKTFLIDEILDADATGHYDDVFMDAVREEK